MDKFILSISNDDKNFSFRLSLTLSRIEFYIIIGGHPIYTTNHSFPRYYRR